MRRMIDVVAVVFFHTIQREVLFLNRVAEGCWKGQGFPIAIAVS